jgi:hypothetical protein
LAYETARAINGAIGAHTKWANTRDRSAATARARQAFQDRFEREVDPDGTLSPEDRARRAEHARKAFYLRLSAASAKARRAGAVRCG